MNIVHLPSSRIFYNNNFFDVNKARDSRFEPYANLKKSLESKNSKLNTFDVHDNNEKIDIVIIHRVDLNFGNLIKLIKKNSKTKIIYIVSEERTVCPIHTKEILQSSLFDLVLTWDDKMVDEQYFLKYNYPSARLQVAEVIPFREKKFITMINGYKFSKHNKIGELYTKRIEALHYFADKGCDLYGTNWSKCKDKKITGIYRGEVEAKHATLKGYKFSICFENTSNEYGAITEKIFDCFAAGCVPVYWGAPNVEQYIPKACFIDFRNFASYDELHHFLNTMDETTYNQYIDAIRKFMLSKEYDNFNSIGYVRYMEDAINRVQSMTSVKRTSTGLRIEWLKKIFLNPQLFWNRLGLKMLFEITFS